MKKGLFLLKAAVAFLFALVVSFNLVTDNAWALGKFSRTCENISISGSKLSASCEKANGGFNQTSINLNPYIENVDGKLTWQPSNFIETCRGTGLSGSNVLKAECKTRNQNFVSTSINLDDHIANIDGKLQFE
ncbi:CVNH domain-containing protein [Brasilonema sp. UFV-L1]|uniref:mannose-binding lectin n=1 Tax=Brasilonema sp. UFV-L1 TaxID=2234130 RepID=UPI00145CDC42|nr:CVNH domain-containing protein [Brasilonema sp. UFV-L1]NMG06876.1 cyanovirin [Brasilonema sp. UFV-L1]